MITMHRIFLFRFHWLLASFLLLVSCTKDSSNPAEDTDHSAVTTVILQFKQGGVIKFEYGFDDPDGIGGNAPTRFDKIVLDKGQTYLVDMVLQNKTGGSNKDMTASIRSAGKYHEFFYLPQGFSINITKEDKDELGYPLGMQTTWVTPSSPANGTLRFTLQHLLIKKAVNLPTDGHSDIAIDFMVEIK
jgi:hypothetical protein